MTWRTEPVYVEKCLDDLWVGVKGQSNLEIARTLRNAFRSSVCVVEAKASLNRATQSVGVDAKPGDLPMSRLKCQ